MESEIRSLRAELRAQPGFKLEGTAAKFGTRSHDLGGFIETIAPSAFKRSLEEGAKIVVTVNHDPNQVLGNTKAGTAKVWADNVGLRFSVQLDPANTNHANTYASVKRGDLDSCSFAFRVPAGGDSFTQTKDGKGKPIALRTLKDVDLIDCSVVAYPAYPTGTEVDARSLEARGLLRVAARSSAPTTPTKPVARPLTDEECARMNEQTLDEYYRHKEMNHRSVQLTRARDLGRQIEASQDADRRTRAEKLGKQIQADAAQELKDNALRERMEVAAGRIHSRTCRGR